MKFAEHCCRRLHMGFVHFSPMLNFWRKSQELWRLVIRRKLGRAVKATTIRRLVKKLDIWNPLASSLSEARRLLDTATQRYEALKPQHEALRQAFLFNRLQDPTLSDEHHRAIAKLVAAEKTREAYRRIRVLKGCKMGNSISQVEIDTPTGPHILSSRQEIEAQLCNSLQTRFTKAHGSPFLHGRLAQDVGPYGCGAEAQAILHGTYVCPPESNEYTRLFVEALRWPRSHPDIISTILSPEAFCTHWRRAKEHTSSSYSGLHFGHYKAVAYSPLLLTSTHVSPSSSL